MPPATASITVSLMVEIPETLHLSIQDYLDTHEMWSQERMMQAALSLFLLQNGVNQPHVNSLYLDSLFGCAAQLHSNRENLIVVANARCIYPTRHMPLGIDQSEILRTQFVNDCQPLQIAKATCDAFCSITLPQNATPALAYMSQPLTALSEAFFCRTTL